MAQVQDILDDSGILAGSTARTRNRAPVADSVRPRIRHDVGHALRVALLQLGLQAVIQRVPPERMHVGAPKGDIAAGIAARELHIAAPRGGHEGRTPGAALVNAAGGRDHLLGDGVIDVLTGPGDVLVPTAHHVIHLVPEVADFPERVTRQRVLDVEVPVLRHRPVRLWLPARHLDRDRVTGTDRVWRQTIPERVLRRVARIGHQTDFEMERRLSLLILAAARVREGPVEDAVCHPQDRLLGQLVGDSQARSEVRGIRLGETPGGAVNTGDLDHALRDAAGVVHVARILRPATVGIWPFRTRVKVPDAVTCLQERRIVLVAQPEVQRQPVVDLPVILHVEVLVRRAHVHVDQVRSTQAVRSAEQKVGESVTAAAEWRVARELAREGHPAERELWIDDAGLHEEDLRAKLDRVIALGPRVVHGHLSRLGLDQVGSPVGVAEGLPAADLKNCHAAKGRVKPGEPDLLVDVSGDVRVNLGVGVKVVPAEPDVGDKRGAPDAVPSEGGVVAGHIKGVATRNERAEIGCGRQAGPVPAILLLRAPAEK